MTSIKDGWISYARVLHPQAGLNQRLETRRAFYAGASVILEILARLGGEDVPEAVGLDRLKQLHREIERFLEDLKGGRA